MLTDKRTRAAESAWSGARLLRVECGACGLAAAQCHTYSRMFTGLPSEPVPLPWPQPCDRLLVESPSHSQLVAPELTDCHLRLIPAISRPQAAGLPSPRVQEATKFPRHNARPQRIMPQDALLATAHPTTVRQSQIRTHG